MRSFVFYFVISIVFIGINGSCKPRKIITSNLDASAENIPDNFCSWNPKDLYYTNFDLDPGRFKRIFSLYPPTPEILGAASQFISNNAASLLGPSTTAVYYGSGNFTPQGATGGRLYQFAYDGSSLIIDLDPTNLETNSDIKKRMLLAWHGIRILSFVDTGASPDNVIRMISADPPNSDGSYNPKEMDEINPQTLYSNIVSSVNAGSLKSIDDWLTGYFTADRASAPGRMSRGQFDAWFYDIPKGETPTSLGMNPPPFIYSNLQVLRTPVASKSDWMGPVASTETKLPDDLFDSESVLYLPPDQFKLANGHRPGGILNANLSGGFGYETFYGYRVSNSESVPYDLSIPTLDTSAAVTVIKRVGGQIPKGNLPGTTDLQPGNFILVAEQNSASQIVVSRMLDTGWARATRDPKEVIATVENPNTGSSKFEATSIAFGGDTVDKNTLNEMPEYLAIATNTKSIYILKNVRSLLPATVLTGGVNLVYRIHKIINISSVSSISRVHMTGDSKTLMLFAQTTTGNSDGSTTVGHHSFDLTAMLSPQLVMDLSTHATPSNKSFWKAATLGLGTGADTSAIYASVVSPKCDGFIVGAADGLVFTTPAKQIMTKALNAGAPPLSSMQECQNRFNDRITTLQYSTLPNKDLLLTSSMDGQVSTYDSNIFADSCSYPTNYVKPDPDGGGIVSAAFAKLESIIAYSPEGGGFRSVVINPDQKTGSTPSFISQVGNVKIQTCNQIMTFADPDLTQMGSNSITFSGTCSVGPNSNQEILSFDKLTSQVDPTNSNAKIQIDPRANGASNSMVLDLTRSPDGIFTVYSQVNGIVTRTYTGDLVNSVNTNATDLPKLCMDSKSNASIVMPFVSPASPNDNRSPVVSMKWTAIEKPIMSNPAVNADTLLTVHKDGSLVLSNVNPSCKDPSFKDHSYNFLNPYFPMVYNNLPNSDIPANVTITPDLKRPGTAPQTSYAFVTSMSGKVYMYWIGQSLNVP